MTQPLHDRTFPVLVIASPPISPFNPDDTLAAAILRDLASSRGSLAAVANAHGVSIADLALSLDSHDARQRIAAIERGSYVAVRLAATLNLPSAVDALSQILTDFRDLSKSGIDHNDPAYLRAAIQARKAALQLCRLSRAVPIDESHIKDMLAAARARAAAHAASRATGSNATGCLSTSAPRSPSSPAPSSPAPSSPVSSSPVPSSPPRSFASSAFNTPSPPLRNSVSSAPSAFSSSSTPCPAAPSKLGDSLAERTPQPSTRGGPQDRRGLPSAFTPSPPLRNSVSSAPSAFSSPTRGGPQDRRGLRPADLIRAATGPPLSSRGSSP